MKIHLNEKTAIDLPTLIESRLLVQANSGGGKSWLLRRLLEQSHGKVQQIVIDPEGEFSTLREKYDYILCGKGGDTPAEPRSAALLARKLLELGVSAIVDLYELHPQERKRFVKLFLDSMVNSPKELHHPCLVVIDEAHTFAPEKGQSEAMDAVIGLASLGRKRHFCAILATQRISKLHKDVAAECNNKLIGRTGLDIDMKRAGEELGFTAKEQFLNLRKLSPGEFFAFGPAISGEVIKLQVGEVRTSHQNMSLESAIKSAPPTEKIKAALKKLTDLPQEVEEEARTSAELRKEVISLRKELSAAKRMPGAPSVKIERIEVPVVGKRALEGMKEAEMRSRKAIKAMKEYAEMIEKSVDKLSGELEKIDEKSPIPTTRAMPAPLGAAQRTFAPRPMQQIGDSAKNDRDSGITGPEKRILDAIALIETIGVTEPERSAVAFLAGYKVGGGGFNNPTGSLRSKGLIEYRGNNIALTPVGRDLAAAPDRPLTKEELHRKVMSILPGPEQRLLRPLLDCYPEAMSNEALATASGYTVGSGGFNNPKGRLRTLGLVEYPEPSFVRARGILFIN